MKNSSCWHSDYNYSIQIFESGSIRTSGSLIEVTCIYRKQIRLLVADRINDVDQDDKKSDVDDKIPHYIQQLFSNMVNERHWLSLNIARLNADICYVDETDDIWYGYGWSRNEISLKLHRVQT